MNKIFRVIWNQSTQTWVAVSELAKGKAKSSSGDKCEQTVSFKLSSLNAAIALGLSIFTANAFAAIAEGTFVNAPGDKSNVAKYGTPNNLVGRDSAPLDYTTAVDGLAIGDNSISTHRGGTAIGSKSLAGNVAVAVGAASTANGTSSVALGVAALAQGVNSLAIMRQAGATGAYSMAIGTAASVSSEAGIGIGKSVLTTGTRGIAIGSAVNSTTSEYDANTNTQATGTDSIALGTKARASSTNALATGTNSLASGENTTSLGSYATTTAANAAALGTMTAASQVNATAVGAFANASGVNATALGANSLAFGADSVATGSGATAQGGQAIATGLNAQATAGQAIATGMNATATGDRAIATGLNAAASDQNAIATGFNSKALSDSSIAIGHASTSGKQVLNADGTVNSTLSSTSTVAIGNGANATGKFSMSFGSYSNATALRSITIGASSNATAENASALGTWANASLTGSVALGNSSVTGTAVPTTTLDYSFLGDSANAVQPTAQCMTANSLVSVGSNTYKRKITNVAAGTVSVDSTEAINGSQLYDVVTKVGFNIQENGAAKSRINNNNIVNFANGTYTTASVTDGANSSTVKFNVVNQAITTTNGVASATGTAGLATSADVVNAVNNTGFNLQANGANGSFVKSGDTVNIAQGSNIVVSKSGNTVTVATSMTPTFTTMTTTGDAKIGGNLNMDGGKITNLANGTTNGDAVNFQQLTEVKNLANLPLTFTGNAGTSERQLGQTLNISGLAQTGTAYSAKNVNTIVTDGRVEIQISENPVFKTLNVTDKINAGSLTVTGDSLLNTVTAAGTIAANGGLTVGAGQTVDMGGNQITGVAEGTNGTDAVNLDQLNKAVANASGSWNLGINGSADITAVDKTNNTVLVQQGDNIVVTKKGNNITVATSKTPIFDSVETTSLSTGSAEIQGELEVRGEAVFYGGITFDGVQTVDMGDNQINNVKEGVADTDAVNVSQLKEVKTVADNAIQNFTTSVNGQPVETITKDNNDVGFVNGTGTTARDANGDITFDVNKTTFTTTNGTVTAGNTGDSFATANDVANAINNATAAAKTEVVAGQNIEVTNATGANGQTIYTVKTSDTPAFTSVDTTALNATGNSTLSGNTTIGGTDKTFTVANGTTVNMGGNVVSNVANGTVSASSTDAVNGSQLYSVQSIANSALQNFTTSVNGAAVETIDKTNNDVGFVNGTGTTARNDGGNITFDVNKTTFTTTNGTVTAGNTGDSFATANDVANAINNISTSVINKGLSFTGNDGNVSTQALGTTLNITGAASTAGAYSSANVKTVVTDGKVEIQIADNPVFESVTAKDVTTTNLTATTANITTVNAKDVNSDNVTTQTLNVTTSSTLGGNVTVGGGKDTTFSVVKDTTVDMGGNTVNNVGTATQNDQATNLGQVKDMLSGSAWNLTAGAVNGGVNETDPTLAVEQINPNDQVVMQAGKNIKVKREANGTITYSTQDDVSFSNVTSTNLNVTGNSTLGGNVTVGGGTGTTFAVKPDTKVDMGGNNITNVADGVAPTDAVNKGQLDNLGTTLTNLGLSFTGNSGTTARKLGETLNISGAATTAGAYSSANVKTVVTNGKVEIQFAESPTFASLNTTGDATIGGNQTVKGNQTVEKDLTVNGNSTLDNNVTVGGGKDTTFSVVKDTTVDMGGNTVNNVGTATQNDQATNLGQVKDMLNGSAWNLTAGAVNGGVNETDPNLAVEQINPNDQVVMQAGKNIKVKREANGTITYSTQDDVSFNNVTTNNLTATSANITGNAQIGGTLTTTGMFYANGGLTVANGQTVDMGNNIITNVAAGVNATDAVNKGQLDNLGASLTNKGLSFTGNDGTTARKLGETLNISGAATTAGAYSSANVRTVVTDGKVEIQIAESPTFANLTTTGDATIGGNQTVAGNQTVKGDQTVNGDSTVKGSQTIEKDLTVKGDSNLNGNTTVGGGAGTSFSVVKDTAVDMGGNTVNNVGNATKDDQATNLGQVKDLINNVSNDLTNLGMNFTGNNGEVVTRKLGDTLTVKGSLDNSAPASSKNIRTEANAADGSIEVLFSEKPTFASLTTTGDVDIGGNLDMNGNKISGVADGDISATSKDAVNGSQLYAVNQVIYGDNAKTQSVTLSNGTKVDVPVVEQDGKTYSLTTYNVKGQTEYVTNSVISAISNMNEQGIKFFHTNDGVTTPNDQRSNSVDSSAGGAYATAIGYKADAAGESALAVGNNATATGDKSISIGGSTVSGDQSLSLGSGNSLPSANAGAIGNNNQVSGEGSFAVGNGNTIATSNTYALGSQISQTLDNSVFLGNGAGYVAAGSTTRGKESLAGQAIGGRLFHYAGGSVGQVAGVVSVGNVAADGTMQTRRIQNVAPGLVSAGSTDAVNGSQLYSAINNFDSKLGDVNNRMANMDRDLRSGIAGAAAMATLVQAYNPSESILAIGGAGYRGGSALALGYSKVSDNGRIIIKLTGSVNNAGHYIGGASVGFKF